MNPSISSTQAFVLERIIVHDIADKGENFYYEHVSRVAISLSKRYGEDTFLVNLAYMHDMIEDDLITNEELKERGYSQEFLDSLSLLTRKKEDSYEQYIQKLIDSEDINALRVKRADLEDNMNLTRLKIVTKKDVKRVENRYIPTWYKVNEIITKLEK